MGLGTTTISGGSAKQGERGGEADRQGFLLERRFALDCFELNNLTVIDLHVTRSAVHLINVVADFKKKGTFHNFLPIAK